jgi:hypothetical protein
MNVIAEHEIAEAFQERLPYLYIAPPGTTYRLFRFVLLSLGSNVILVIS